MRALGHAPPASNRSRSPRPGGGLSRFLVASDKFKGTFDAGEVVGAVAAGLRDGGAAAVEMPVADGGEGTAAALLSSLGGEWLTAATEDALSRPVEGRVALLADGRTAVIEVAEASGMWRLRPGEMDAVAASSRGTGMLIVAAAEAGADRVIVAPGGSATTDGGAGMLEVVEASGCEAEVTVACDVDIPWERAAEVFGPQKGASPAQVTELNRRLDALAAAAPRDPRGVPRTGCGGGISGALWAHLDAKLVSGADLVLDAIGFDRALERCDGVVTGEGRLDAQTAGGKAVAAVAGRSAASGRPCHALVGTCDLAESGWQSLGLTTVREATDLAALRQAGRDLAIGSASSPAD